MSPSGQAVDHTDEVVAERVRQVRGVRTGGVGGALDEQAHGAERAGVDHDAADAVGVALVEVGLPDVPVEHGPAGVVGARVGEAQQLGPLGLRVKELDAATIARMRLPLSIQGLFVTEVDPAGPARLARLRTGHVLLEINRRRMTTLADFRAILATLKPNEAVAVLVYDAPSDQRVLATILPDPSS